MTHIPHTSIGYCKHRLDQPRDLNTLPLGCILSPTQQFKTLTRPLAMSTLPPVSYACDPLPSLLSRPQQNRTLLRHLLRHPTRPQAKPACSYGITEPLFRRSEGKEDGKVGTALTNTLSLFPCVSRSCLCLRLCLCLGIVWLWVGRSLYCRAENHSLRITLPR